MASPQLYSIYHTDAGYRKLSEWLGNPEPGVVHLKGLAGSSGAFIAASCLDGTKENHLFVLPDKEEAAYFYNDLQNLNAPCELAFFPSSYKRSVQYWQKSQDNIILRTSVMKRIAENRPGLAIITYPEALAEKVLKRELLSRKTFSINKEDKISLSLFTEKLQDLNFIPVDFVYEPGQYAIRGSIIDVFSFSEKQPFRIDFYGNEVDSIRTFEIDSQLSINNLKTITLFPDTALDSQIFIRNQGLSVVPFTAFIGRPLVLWMRNSGFVCSRIDEIVEKTKVEYPLPETDGIMMDKYSILSGCNDVFANFHDYKIIEYGPDYLYDPVSRISFSTTVQPSFNKNFELLGQNLKQNSENGYTNYIFSDNDKQVERLRSIFNEIDEEVQFESVITSLHSGFTDHTLRFTCYTDHQIFDRYHRYRLDEHFTRSESLAIQELTGLHPGDYVVHIDHGIGQFGGLEKITLHGKLQEAIKLVYKDNDTLYVSIHALHRISKYKGKDGQPPRIYKLGSGAWQKLKSSTKKKVKDIARELIKLYAIRKSQAGFGFSPDSYLQNELEASFIYEDTEDQLKATGDVKRGMEATYPMDMLICGDVGFGKTEIAVRAAFKAVTDSKQVALLVPTTILALQHYSTFCERLKDFPATIDYISRLKKPALQKKTLEKLAEGSIDIIIGTHRLVSKDVNFRDLGLLIIDEEQKFGVSVKETLKKMKLNVDTLTLTATPIPRTLQLSLMGARDLSVINTPPPNRQPIVTELHTFNEDIIRDAIYYEVGRNGQVFFIHNRIQNISEVESLVNRICPDVSTVVAHGQMEGSRLEKIMVDFISGHHDVLIATTIVESGLDIPNTNTIIINNAHQFGLSDLHQLRGRVGRSNKKAFCYMLAPPVHLITNEARKRLQAISEFSELGSGFYLAMQDLDIRGAGNLLGAEQSGFIAEIGFETYHRILDEALLELKEDEFSELFDEKEKNIEKTEDSFISDCHIDTDMELLFPDEYVNNISERLRLYKTLDDLKTEEQLKDFETQLTDRFGNLPLQARELLQVVRLRWIAVKLGFEKIILKNSKMILHFITNPDSAYYKSDIFGKMLGAIQKQPSIFRLKESENKLRLSVENIHSISQATEVLEHLSG